MPTAASASTVSGRAPSSANVGLSGRTGAFATRGSSGCDGFQLQNRVDYKIILRRLCASDVFVTHKLWGVPLVGRPIS